MAVQKHTQYEDFSSFTKATGANTEIRAYRILDLGTDGNVSEAQAASKNIVAVTDRAYSTTDTKVSAVLLSRGIVEIEAGDDVAVRSNITSDSQGRGVVASSGEQYFAKALEAATSGNTFRAVIVPAGSN